MATQDNTAPSTGDTTDYADKDLNHQLLNSNILEDISGDTPPPAPEASPEAAPAADATTPTDVPPVADAATEGASTTDETTPSDTTDPAADATADATTGDDVTANTEEDDIMKIISEIKTGDDAVTAASDQVDEAIASGNQDDIKTAYEALKVEKQKQDDKVNQLMTELDAKNSSIAGLIDDKMSIEQSNKEKSRIADVVLDDDDLKSLVAFSNKAQTDESYKAKLVTVLERMWEKYTGQSMDELKDAERVATKSQMGENGYSSTAPRGIGNVDAPADLLGSSILEQLP